MNWNRNEEEEYEVILRIQRNASEKTVSEWETPKNFRREQLWFDKNIWSNEIIWFQVILKLALSFHIYLWVFVYSVDNFFFFRFWVYSWNDYDRQTSLILWCWHVCRALAHYMNSSTNHILITISHCHLISIYVVVLTNCMWVHVLGCTVCT